MQTSVIRIFTHQQVTPASPHSYDVARLYDTTRDHVLIQPGLTESAFGVDWGWGRVKQTGLSPHARVPCESKSQCWPLLTYDAKLTYVTYSVQVDFGWRHANCSPLLPVIALSQPATRSQPTSKMFLSKHILLTPLVSHANSHDILCLCAMCRAFWPQSFIRLFESDITPQHRKGYHTLKMCMFCIVYGW